MVFKKIREAFSMRGDGASDNEYLEIDLEQEKKEHKVLVRFFVLKDYEDANLILNSIREGYTIAIIDIRTLKKKDPIELKRAISKIKKTVDALEGSIAGFGEVIVATPSFAKIPKEVQRPKEEKKRDDFDMY